MASPAQSHNGHRMPRKLGWWLGFLAFLLSSPYSVRCRGRKKLFSLHLFPRLESTGPNDFGQKKSSLNLENDTPPPTVVSILTERGPIPPFNSEKSQQQHVLRQYVGVDP
ncbi:hypothetical protein FA13DRAFT_782503 [Coprinellus micaceus]|uniref:Uncharacterized protein n=1 Tax=Coprinellus micaceus TaxID=71717 RepID=A0A4Y7S6J6_COPMI|nr:hypothetical protein FA13DRAFT_782503 [Coprinellus micaceus]